jgi:hypothetical protein
MIRIRGKCKRRSMKENTTRCWKRRSNNPFITDLYTSLPRGFKHAVGHEEHL